VKREIQDILQAQDQRETEGHQVCTVDYGFSSSICLTNLYSFVSVAHVSITESLFYCLKAILSFGLQESLVLFRCQSSLYRHIPFSAVSTVP